MCYTNTVVSGLILKMRSEDTLLAKGRISLPFHSVYTLAIKADHEAAEILIVIKDHQRKISKNCYLCILIDSKVYCIVTYSLLES